MTKAAKDWRTLFGLKKKQTPKPPSGEGGKSSEDPLKYIIDIEELRVIKKHTWELSNRRVKEVPAHRGHEPAFWNDYPEDY
jgi:hypothetical protein